MYPSPHCLMTRKASWIVCTAIIGAFLSATLNAQASERSLYLSRVGLANDSVREVNLDFGHSLAFATDFSVKRVSVGDPSIADVLVMTAKEVALVPVGMGTTNVLIWGNEPAPLAILNVKVGPAFGNLQRRVAALVGSEDFSIEDIGGAIAVSGSVPDLISAESALRLIEAGLSSRKEYAQLKLVNMLRVRGQQQVLLHVKIAEVSRSLTRQFGANFNGLFNTQGGPIQVTGLLGKLATPTGSGGIGASEVANLVGSLSGFGALESLELVLSALRQKGLAKVLAEPMLVARSGENASFLVGGEIPIPVAQGGSSAGSITIEYRKFGVGLSFTPTVLRDGRIHLSVSPEVSEPDFSIGTTVQGTSVPGFNTRRASTGVELGNGESFAIAGLFRDDLRELSAAYPGLGEIPVLGALFRNSRYEQRETELVIVVTPTLVAPIPKGESFRLPSDSVHPPSAAEFYLLGRIESGQKSTDQEKTIDAAILDSRRSTEITSPNCEADSESSKCKGTHTTVVEVSGTASNIENGLEQAEGFLGTIGFEIPVGRHSNLGEH